MADVAPGVNPGLATRRERARGAWHQLATRLGTITPSQAGRIGLVTALIAGAGWIVVASWPALAPIAAGLLLAYILLPVVDGLDAIMPRVLASILAVLGALALVVGVLVMVVPPFTAGILNFVAQLPSAQQLEALLADLEAAIGDLPAGVDQAVAAALAEIVGEIGGLLSASGAGIEGIGSAFLDLLLGAFSAALGLIILPSWILTVLREKGAMRRAVDARLAGWLRSDFWAIARIADRSASAYFRGYLLIAALTGGGVYLGLVAAERLGLVTAPNALPVAVFAGAVQLIPTIGGILAFVPALLIAPISIERAVLYVVVYLASIWLANAMGGARTVGRLGVHPAILLPGIVALSQFGLIWVLLAGPLLSFVQDAARYLYGRLGEPARPAGVLPGEPLPRIATAAAAHVPSIYVNRAPGASNLG
jgi:predicted PurR-regulated permease PerM